MSYRNSIVSYEQTKDRFKGKPVFRQRMHGYARASNHQLITETTEGSVNTGIISSAPGLVNFRVAMGRGGLVLCAYLRIEVTVANAAVTLAPTPLWLDKVTLFADAGGNSMQILQGENLFAHLNMLPAEKLRQMSSVLNIDHDYNPIEMQPGSKVFYIPLLGLALEGVYLKKMKHDPYVRADFVNALEQGLATNVTVSDIKLLLLEEEIENNTPLDRELTKMYDNGVVERKYIHYILTERDPTLSAGTQRQIQLSEQVGKLAFLHVGLRTSKLNANGARRKWEPVGDQHNNGTLELKDQNGHTISGSAIDFAFYKALENADLYPGDLFSHPDYNIYTIAHGDPVMAALQGVCEGYYYYEDGKFSIYITPGANTAEVARVVTLTGGADADVPTAVASDAGSFRLIYRRGDGHVYTSSQIAFNATNAVINSAIAEMNIPDITVSSATGLDEVAGLVLTVTGLRDIDLAANGAYWDALSKLEDGGEGVVINVAETTAGSVKRGFTSGQYALSVYGAEFFTLRIMNGTFEYSQA